MSFLSKKPKQFLSRYLVITITLLFLSFVLLPLMLDYIEPAADKMSWMFFSMIPLAIIQIRSFSYALHNRSGHSKKACASNLIVITSCLVVCGVILHFMVHIT
jgi:hypothetical protein